MMIDDKSIEDQCREDDLRDEHLWTNPWKVVCRECLHSDGHAVNCPANDYFDEDEEADNA